MQQALPLANIFDDPNFAWELLEWEIAIEMNESVDGLQIAKLLELYMRGVEKMNSLLDVRESYFKNKVTSLMGRRNVIQSLSKPPMAKKEKPLEVNGVKTQKPAKKKTKNSKNEEHPETLATIHKTVNNHNLKQKKKEIELRLAYESESNSPENLKKMLKKQNQKEENMSNNIKKVINEHEQRLEQRIKNRRLRTTTYRSKKEEVYENQLELPMTSPQQNKKALEELLTMSSPKAFEEKIQAKKLKKHRSLEAKARSLSSEESQVKKNRKSTFQYNQKDEVFEDSLEFLKNLNENPKS